MRPPGTSGAPPAAGWYPDPGGLRQLSLVGRRPLDRRAVLGDPAREPARSTRDDSRSWALAAHLSPLVGLFVGLPPIGPLIVYLAKKDDPYVRRHAAEALNFNISF